MKRISKNKIEFDCTVRAVSPIQTSEEDAENIEIYVHYFDRQDHINLVMKGNYKAEHLKRLIEMSQNMELVKITIEVSERDQEKVTINVSSNNKNRKEDYDI